MHADNFIVITNTVKAKFYQIIGFEYKLVKEFEHPKGRLRTNQISSDGPGHFKTDHASRGKFSETNAHNEEQKIFAKIVVDFMTNIINKKPRCQFVLCAEPHFYGMINQHLKNSTKASIIEVIEQDYIPFPESKLNHVIEGIIHESF